MPAREAVVIALASLVPWSHFPSAHVPLWVPCQLRAGLRKEVRVGTLMNQVLNELSSSEVGQHYFSLCNNADLSIS